ncbi:hypothetical protein BDN70DRAFT_870658 [Pholiota conissans]|uniref:Uncharacterized protein n=1 Tax=Pholiota conissans TaxID=109636 RepID=A0A9P6CYY3_9AGAR|nr:hypothetical protein BDN70DRAFT_870658 [Pholiota conissans]
MSSNFNQTSGNPRRQESQSGSGVRESLAGQNLESSSFGGHNPSSNVYGRDTSLDSSQTMDSMHSSNLGRRMTGTGTGTGAGATHTYTGVGTTEVGPQEFTVTTGINSGAGLHAEQYQGRNPGQAGTTSSTMPGVHHHHGTAYHGEGFVGECHHPECATCMSSSGAYASPVVGTGQSMTSETGGGIGIGHHTSGTHHSTGHHTDTGLMGGSGTYSGDRTAGTMGTGGSTGTTMPQHMHMGGSTMSGMPPGNVAYESTTTSTTTEHPSGRTTGSSGTGSGMGSTSGTAGKPTMTDKIMGGAEKVAGKVTGNEAMEIHGQERKTGELNKN